MSASSGFRNEKMIEQDRIRKRERGESKWLEHYEDGAGSERSKEKVLKLKEKQEYLHP